MCLLGGDNVRSYRVEERGGDVWVELTDPPAEEICEKTLRDLKRAFEKRAYGRMCREITRLHFHDVDTLQAVRKAVEWSHDRLEFGSTHVYAARPSGVFASAKPTTDGASPSPVATNTSGQSPIWYWYRGLPPRETASCIQKSRAPRSGSRLGIEAVRSASRSSCQTRILRQ